MRAWGLVLGGALLLFSGVALGQQVRGQVPALSADGVATLACQAAVPFSQGDGYSIHCTLAGTTGHYVFVPNILIDTADGQKRMLPGAAVGQELAIAMCPGDLYRLSNDLAYINTDCSIPLPPGVGIRFLVIVDADVIRLAYGPQAKTTGDALKPEKLCLGGGCVDVAPR